MIKWPEERDEENIAEYWENKGFNEALSLCKQAYEEAQKPDIETMMREFDEEFSFASFTWNSKYDGEKAMERMKDFLRTHLTAKQKECNDAWEECRKAQIRELEMAKKLDNFTAPVTEIKRIFLNWMSSAGESRLTPDEVNELALAIHSAQRRKG